MADAVLNARIDSNTGEVAKGMEEVAKNTENVGKAAQKSSGGVKKLGVSFGTLMKATGIVALLSKAFEVLKEVFMSNQKVVDGFNVVMESLKRVFNDLFKVITDNVEPIKAAFKALFEDPKQAISDFSDAFYEGFTKRFEQAGDVVNRLSAGFGKLFKGDFKGALEEVKEAGKEAVDVITGVDDSYEDVKNTIVDYTTEVVKGAKAQVAANKAAQFAELEVRKLQAENLKAAEDERQIRDNVNLSFQERIEANQRLSKILEEQQNAQKSALQTEIDALAMAVQVNASDENKLALLAKEIEMLELEEAINGQMSEQLTNQVALENELRDAKQQTMLEGLSASERELEELRIAYEEKKRLAEQAGMDTTAITAQYESEKTAIMEANNTKQLKFSEMSQKQQLGIASSTAGDMATILGEETAAGKAMAITQTSIDTFQSAQGAFKSMAGIPVVGPALGAVAAAAAIVAGMKNIQAIKSASSSGPSGGGGGGRGAAAAAAPAPQMMSGEFDLTGGIEPEATRAYVVTDEMTDSQNQLANIRRRSTI